MNPITHALTHLAGQSGELSRPDGPILSPSDLRPADVLLSRGVGPISDAIVAADRAAYSHAAIWSGDSIIEATIKGGVAKNPPGGERYVFRYHPELDTARAASIVDVAHAQVGNQYATAEIHLLAVVFKKWGAVERPRQSLASTLLNLLGGSSAPRLEAWLQERYARSAPRICSELVAVAYYTAGTPLLLVAPAERGAAQFVAEESLGSASAVEQEQLDELDQTISKSLYGNDLLEQVAVERAVTTKEAKGILFGHLAVDAMTGVPVDIVTPGDLQFSQSLRFVGKIAF
jgi:hypothetical protein